MRVIAEIGINHSGELKVARDLIDSAFSCGCWGIKFQYRNLTNFYASKDEVADGILFEDLEKCQLSISELLELTSYAKTLGLKVGISFFKKSDIQDFKDEITNFDFYKIPSAECLNVDLLEELLSFQRDVLVSTGGHHLDEIEQVLSKYKATISILHCVANYPTKTGNQQLGTISRLKHMGFKSVGYSSHDEDYEMCLFSISYGIDYLERHITFDKTANGLDHSSSSNIQEFQKICYFAKSAEHVMSYNPDMINQGELMNMQNLGCGLYLSKNIQEGMKVQKSDFSIKAPRLGISYGEYLYKFQNQPLACPVMKGDSLTHSDFVKNIEFDLDALSDFANRRDISLPVRLHDFTSFNQMFRLNNYEFHLSYQEILSAEIDDIAKAVTPSKRISIHLPDYIPGNIILDPISNSEQIRDASLDIITKTKHFAEKLYDITGSKIKIVGSFSRVNQNKLYSLKRINDFVDANKTKFCEILPQWLPGFAWYFGGTEKIELFNDQEDIEFIQSNNLKICLDVSHLGMAAKTNKSSVNYWFDSLVPFANHLHVADFKGEDGEGLQIGDGEFQIFDRVLRSSQVKVLEVWRGHLDNGAGFKRALQNLYSLDELHI